MVANITDTLSQVSSSTTGRPVIAQLAAPGKALAAASINLNDVTNWTTATAIHISIYNTTTISGVTVKDPTTQTDWKGVLAGTTVSGLVLTGGNDRTYTAGALVEITPTARYAKDLYENISAHANQDGSLKTAAVQAALNIGTTPADYTILATPPSTVVYNGNRNYTITYPAVDYTNVTNPGTRWRGTRTVAAPTQCTNLNGTTQYYTKTSPAGMTFTDDFAGGTWIKLTSYASSRFMGRWNGTNGWVMEILSDGRVNLFGNNGGPSNYSQITSYQSIPLNRWVHVAAQLDMSTFTATTTTSYVMLDGQDVPAVVSRGGTNPTALVQAGDFQIGAANGATFHNGKLAQTWVSSAKITQANIRTLISQGLTSALITANSIISAYSFDNNINDLNTTNANNLTAVGSAVATNADSPFGNQANGLISSTLEYGIIQRSTFSTDTTIVVQVPEGCAIPTSGGLTTTAYSSARNPYGFPGQRDKWQLKCLVLNTIPNPGGAGSLTIYNAGGINLNVPIGSWDVRGELAYDTNPNSTTAQILSLIHI
jgi:hypothetical protein